MDRWNDWLQGEDTVLIRVGGALDAAGYYTGPMLIRVEPLSKRAGVRLTRLSDEPGASVIEATDCVLVPGLCNAHTHLDLSHIGPQPYERDAGFEGWLGMILRNRATAEPEIARAVRRGIRLSLNGGVVAVGDIAGTWSTTPAAVLASSPLMGVSYIEGFGLGSRQVESAEKLASLAATASQREACTSQGDAGVRVSTSPHAPYTAGPRLIHGAGELGAQLQTPPMIHVAESLAEREFVATGTGPKRALLERIGVWDQTSLDGLAKNQSPVQHVIDALATNSHGVAFAHVNDASDDDIRSMVEAGIHIAYCPRASAYFGHGEDFGTHRYQDIIQAGLVVGLGTDSIVNCPPTQSGRLTTWDDARVLVDRDAITPNAAIGLATVGAASVLGLPLELFLFGACLGKHGVADHSCTLGGVALVSSGQDAPMRPSAVFHRDSLPVLFGRDRLIRTSDCSDTRQDAH